MSYTLGDIDRCWKFSGVDRHCITRYIPDNMRESTSVVDQLTGEFVARLEVRGFM